MLKDFPNISGTPDYTDQPKHADRLDIELINDAPIRQNLRVCRRNRAVIEANFNDFSQRGAVTRGSSYYASPVTIAIKQNCDSRACIDYTRLNNVTKTLNFPIPSIKSPKITNVKNTRARFCELKADLTKNMRDYVLHTLTTSSFFLLTKTVTFRISTLYSIPRTASDRKLTRKMLLL